MIMVCKIVGATITSGWDDGYIITICADFDNKRRYEKCKYIRPLGFIEHRVFKMDMKSHLDEAIKECESEIGEDYQKWVERECCINILTEHAKNVLKLEHNENECDKE